MSAASGRHGRMDNGLTATEYAAAGDVDPRVGEHLLDVLAAQGIAAYLRPSSDLHPVTRTTHLPVRPIDRLFVDRGHVGTAREYLAGLAAEATGAEAEAEAEAGAGAMAADSGEADSAAADSTAADSAATDATATDVTSDGTTAEVGHAGDPDLTSSGGGTGGLDDAWARIVAGFDVMPSGPRPAWPEAEDVPANERPVGTERSHIRRTGTTGAEASPAGEPSLLDGLDTFGADLPDPDEEDFTPPPAPPVPRPSGATILAVLGIVGGLLVFIRPSLLPTSEGLAMVAGIAALAGGFGALVWRLRPGDGDDPDRDDGARV